MMKSSLLQLNSQIKFGQYLYLSGMLLHTAAAAILAAARSAAGLLWSCGLGRLLLQWTVVQYRLRKSVFLPVVIGIQLIRVTH